MGPAQKKPSIAPVNWLIISIHCVGASMRTQTGAMGSRIRAVNNRTRDKVSNKVNKTARVSSKVKVDSKDREARKTSSAMARQMEDHKTVIRRAAGNVVG